MNNSYPIKADERFGPKAQTIAAYLRGQFFKKQHQIIEHAKDMLQEAGFRFEGILRLPNGTKGASLAEVLEANKESNKIIFLTPTLINLQDSALLVPEFITRLFGKIVLSGIDIDATPEGYITFTAKKVNDRFFRADKDTLIIGVLNTCMQDVIDAISSGGNNTVLVLTGHGLDDKFYTSDGDITFSLIETPKDLLKAIIKHACYGIEPSNKGRLADELHYWDRGTNPMDFILNTFAEG